LHLGIVRTAEANGGGALSDELGDLIGDFCKGEFMKSNAGGDDNVP